MTATTHNTTTQPIERLIRRKEVCQLTSLPSSTLTELIASGRFPLPCKPYTGARMSVWRLSEVTNWISSLGK